VTAKLFPSSRSFRSRCMTIRGGLLASSVPIVASNNCYMPVSKLVKSVLSL
jgi:hypothetical protein